MFKRTVLTIISTLVVALVLFGVGAIAFIYSGLYNVAATDSHLGIVRWALNTTQTHSVSARADEVPPRAAMDQETLAHGFSHYNEMCVVCHGAPGVERGDFGKGMNPTPPNLARVAARWTPEELFWTTKHGIKMAGMPAFGPTHSDEEVWGIVAFLERLPKMTPAEYQQWAQRYAAGSEGGGDEHGSGGGSGGEAGGHGHGGQESGASDGTDGAASGGAGHTDPPGAPAHSH